MLLGIAAQCHFSTTTLCCSHILNPHLGFHILIPDNVKPALLYREYYIYFPKTFLGTLFTGLILESSLWSELSPTWVVQATFRYYIV